MIESRKEKAMRLFKEKYNCAQSIMLAYHDLVDIDEEMAFKISSGFEGGIAKLGKTCGTINASIMLLSLKYGESNKEDIDTKNKKREVIRNFMNDFMSVHQKGINCTDILTEEAKTYPMHSEKCLRTVSEVCDLLDKYLTK